MFVAIITYKKQREEVERHLEMHRNFLYDLYDEGCVVASGPVVDGCGGVILFRSPDLASAESLLHNDPFYIHDIADYEIIEFRPEEIRFEELREFFE